MLLSGLSKLQSLSEEVYEEALGFSHGENEGNDFFEIPRHMERQPNSLTGAFSVEYTPSLAENMA